jgi:hypothetical protein
VQKVQRIQRVLRPFDPSLHFNTLRSSLEPNGNYDWIADNDVPTQWLAPSQGQLQVQISRGSKTGRTESALVVLDHLQSLQSSRSSKTQVLYFFCHSPYSQRSTASAVLNGWMYQLFQQRPDMMDDFAGWLFQDPRYVPTYLNQARNMWIFSRRCAKQSSDSGTTHCVLGGLDRCDEKRRSVTMDWLKRTFPLGGCPEEKPRLKILVTVCTPLDDPRFGNIDLNFLVETRPTSPAVRSLSIEEHLERPTLDKKILGSKALQVLAAYFYPPSNSRYLTFPSKNDSPTSSSIIPARASC